MTHRPDEQTRPAAPGGRCLAGVAWAAAVAAAFGLGALVVMDVQATFASPVLGEFYALVLALTCVAAVTSGGALLARWAAGWIRAEIAGLRAEVAALRDRQAGYADGVVHGMGLSAAADPDPSAGPGTVSVLRQRGDRGGGPRMPPA